MKVRLNKDVQIPADAVARLGAAGVLGETFVDIDLRQTSGPPIENGGTLRSIKGPSIEDLVDAIRKSASQ